MAPEQRRSGNGGSELGRFLRARRARRARLTPAEVGLPAGGGLRRTPGLRREELATLAGISIDYYARLERGTETRPSPPVIDALARALRLAEGEHRHLRELAFGADRPATTPSAGPSRTVPEGVELLMESMRPHPVYVVSRTFDLLAANPGGLLLFAGIDEWPAERRNLARYVVLHPTARALIDDWEHALHSWVAWLRGPAAIEPDAPDLTALIDELREHSPEFAELWDRYDVVGSTQGPRLFHHPDVGDFALGFQGMTLNGTNGQFLVAFYAAPGTPDHDAMVLLDQVAHERFG